MPTIRIPPGVVRGESRAYVPGRWHSTNLIRWVHGLMKPVGGWARITENPLLAIPRNAHVWLDNNGVRHMGVVCDHKVFVQKNNIYTDITPTGYIDANSTGSRGYGSGTYGTMNYGSDAEDRGTGLSDPTRPIRHSATNWGQNFLFSSTADGRIFQWDPSAVPVAPATVVLPTPVPNAPILVTAFVVTDERHLMAFGVQGHPNRVAWSDQENHTGWDFTRVTGQAGFYDLEGAGTILSAEKVPGGILIFTSTSVWLARYTGQPYYYGFQKLAEGCSPVSAHSVAVAGSRAIWMGARSFWKYEGGVVVPLPSSLGHEPFENLDTVAPRRVVAGFNGAYPEIWFFYPTDQDLAPVYTENNRYAIYNFEEGWWADGELARTFYTSSPIDQHPIAGDSQTHLYQHEVGYAAEGVPRGDMVWAEIGALSFDDAEHNWQVNQAQIDSPERPESVAFTFRGKRVRGGPTVPFHNKKRARADGFLDLHFTARDFSMRIEEVTAGPWALGAMVFNDVKKRGRL